MGTPNPWAIGLSGAGSLLGAAGAYSSAEAQKTGLNYEANIAAANASLATYQANQSHVIGNMEANASQLKTAQTFGSQRASMAANGVDLSQGSANEVLASTKYLGSVDAMTIQDNATRNATAYGAEATNYATQSSMDTAMAGAINPNMAAGTSLLTGAASLASLF